ncbi:CUB and sushi domain-containing protein 3-like isoform X2 [Branchiostoma floridae]|uniref:CUB and sushi domain-containing protein 3-like isoform X2 n=1 Tax=Branchiostoma floridae TaxID=7739 RepID=A0A9J7MIF5_BRAFL|nr:CUB and sushi domain-containing protein 3-like isoform X2 [Branchiostoma floridae]
MVYRVPLLVVLALLATCGVPQSTAQDCGGTLTNSTGFIQSPGYPSWIYPGIRCTWHIQAPWRNVIAMTILDLYTSSTDELIFHDVNWHHICGGGCEWRIYQGSLGREGLEANHTHWSALNEFEIQFKTYQYARGRGFQVYYRFVSSDTCKDPGRPVNGGLVPDFLFNGTYPARETVHYTCNDGYHPYRRAHVTLLCEAQSDGTRAQWSNYQDPRALCRAECGGNLTSPTGVITSPGQYPDYFEIPADCSWNIQAPAGFTVLLEFETIQLHSHFDDDFLQVGEGDVVTYSWTGRQTTEYPAHPDPITSFSNDISIILRTYWSSGYGPANLTSNNAGFLLHYRFIPAGTSLAGECVDPGTPQHAKRLPESGPYRIGDSLEFRCEEGFELVGDVYITCMEADGPTMEGVLLAEWNSTLPTCEAKCASGIPQQEGYGSIKSPHWPDPDRRFWTGTTGIWGCVWTISAAEGNNINLYFNHTYFWTWPQYEYIKVMQGGTELLRLTKTDWRLPHNPFIVNATSSNTSTVAQIVYYGQYIWGNTLNLYYSTGYCRDPGAPVHGQRQGNSFQPGDTVSFSCDVGYNLVGAATLTCVPGTVYEYQWDSDVPICKYEHSARCPEPQPPGFGFHSDTDRAVGSTVTFWCDAGYHIRGSAARTCGTNQQWTGVQPECVSSPCMEVPPAPLHGRIIPMDVPGTGLFAVTACDVGYFLASGSEARVCNVSNGEGSWDGEPTVCQPVKCGNPGAPQNGNFTAPEFTFPNNATYYCELGYELLGDDLRTCRSNGTWTNDIPTCRIKACGYPRNSDHRVYYNRVNGTIDNMRGFLYGATVFYYCVNNGQGLSINGSVYGVCQADGTWSGNDRTCIPATCPEPIPPANGFIVDPQSEWQYNYVARFACSDGYNLTGNPQIRCGQDGWEGSVPTCVQVTTPTLTTTKIITTPPPPPSTTTTTTAAVPTTKSTAEKTTPPSTSSPSTITQSPGPVYTSKKTDKVPTFPKMTTSAYKDSTNQDQHKTEQKPSVNVGAVIGMVM